MSAEDKKARASSGTKQSGTSRNHDKKQQTKTSYTPPPQSDVQAQHLKTLGLKSGWDYSPDEIKKAYLFHPG